MHFSIRREAHFETYAQDLDGFAHVPIELALPHKLEEYLQGAAELPALAAFIRQRGISCTSVHAAQGRITHDGFLPWARETVRFAESVGARLVVFHPENVRKDERSNLQPLAVRNIRQLQRDTAVRIAVETFGGPKRVLTPEEVGERGMWMVLDTSHVVEERIFGLIDRYHAGIAGIHLSEMREDETTGEVRPHMPVQGFGLDVLHRLEAKGWSGTVTLEYLPDYHDRLLPDRQALEELFPSI